MTQIIINRGLISFYRWFIDREQFYDSRNGLDNSVRPGKFSPNGKFDMRIWSMDHTTSGVYISNVDYIVDGNIKAAHTTFALIGMGK